MSSKVQKYLTKNGKAQLIEKLAYLKVKKSEEIGERLRLARSFGDLSENSEYEDAKEEEKANAEEIRKLEEILKNAILVDEDDVTTDSVFIGLKVKVFNKNTKQEVTYQIVGSGEADPFERKISNESPLGIALMNKKVGDEVEAELPSGKVELKIVEIGK